jgi:hypothetical protein
MVGTSLQLSVNLVGIIVTFEKQLGSGVVQIVNGEHIEDKFLADFIVVLETYLAT